jgi:hypothetical protein
MSIDQNADREDRVVLQPLFGHKRRTDERSFRTLHSKLKRLEGACIIPRHVNKTTTHA